MSKLKHSKEENYANGHFGLNKAYSYIMILQLHHAVTVHCISLAKFA